MTSAVQSSTSADYTEVPFVVRSGVMLGILQSVLVFAFSFASRLLEGTPELIVRAIILLIGIGATTLLPGIWTRARTIEGIAGAAGIGLMATGVFLVVDALLLQNLGTYTNRWLAIGGGSNWWYHPVWWMVGTFLSWMGAWALTRYMASLLYSVKPHDPVTLGLVSAMILATTAVAAYLPARRASQLDPMAALREE